MTPFEHDLERIRTAFEEHPNRIRKAFEQDWETIGRAFEEHWESGHLSIWRFADLAIAFASLTGHYWSPLWGFDSIGRYVLQTGRPFGTLMIGFGDCHLHRGLAEYNELNGLIA